MNIKKIASAASTLLAASLLLSGCSAVSNGDNDAAEVSKPTEIKSIGLMVQDMSNPFFTAMDKEAKAQAKKIGATPSSIWPPRTTRSPRSFSRRSI